MAAPRSSRTSIRLASGPTPRSRSSSKARVSRADLEARGIVVGTVAGDVDHRDDAAVAPARAARPRGCRARLGRGPGREGPERQRLRDGRRRTVGRDSPDLSDGQPHGQERHRGDRRHGRRSARLRFQDHGEQDPIQVDLGPALVGHAADGLSPTGSSTPPRRSTPARSPTTTTTTAMARTSPGIAAGQRPEHGQRPGCLPIRRHRADRRTSSRSRPTCSSPRSSTP